MTAQIRVRKRDFQIQAKERLAALEKKLEFAMQEMELGCSITETDQKLVC